MVHIFESRQIGFPQPPLVANSRAATAEFHRPAGASALRAGRSHSESGSTISNFSVRGLDLADCANRAASRVRCSTSILGRGAVAVAQPTAEAIDAHDLPVATADVCVGFDDLVADSLVIALASIMKLDVLANRALEGTESEQEQLAEALGLDGFHEPLADAGRLGDLTSVHTDAMLD